MKEMEDFHAKDMKELLDRLEESHRKIHDLVCQEIVLCGVLWQC